MWGILSATPRSSHDVRFTPTHVGNTAEHYAVRTRPPVHPHACGEYRVMLSCFQASIGSPPRMWGIRSIAQSSKSTSRFTPTHVGNTTSPPGRSSPPTVHPHACGEYGLAGSLRMVSNGSPTHVGNTPAGWQPRCSFGSPPRMWEYLRDNVQSGEWDGSPVSGNTPLACLCAVSMVPHACGEYTYRVDHLQILSRRFTPRMEYGTDGIQGGPHACGE